MERELEDESTGEIMKARMGKDGETGDEIRSENQE